MTPGHPQLGSSAAAFFLDPFQLLVATRGGSSAAEGNLQRPHAISHLTLPTFRAAFRPHNSSQLSQDSACAWEPWRRMWVVENTLRLRGSPPWWWCPNSRKWQGVWSACCWRTPTDSALSSCTMQQWRSCCPCWRKVQVGGKPGPDPVAFALAMCLTLLQHCCRHGLLQANRELAGPGDWFNCRERKSTIDCCIDSMCAPALKRWDSNTYIRARAHTHTCRSCACGASTPPAFCCRGAHLCLGPAVQPSHSRTLSSSQPLH